MSTIPETPSQFAPRIYCGVKWGLMMPAVMLAAKYYPPPVDHIHLIREFYKPEMLLEDMILEGRTWKEELGVRKFFCDPSQPEFIARMKKAKLRAVPVEQELNLAINMIRRRLVCQVEGVKKILALDLPRKAAKTLARNVPGGLYISAVKCPMIVQEAKKYHIRERKGMQPVKDRPLEVDDYSLSALHFLVVGLNAERVLRVRWIG